MLPELAEARQKRKQAVQELRDKTLNPFLRSIGYKGNAQDQINDIAKTVDFGSKDSIRSAVREMAQIDSNLAANWVRQNEKTIKLLEEPGIDYSQLRTKQLIDKETLEARANQLVGMIGTPTDYDSAVKVLKILDAQGLTGTDRYKGLKQDLRVYSEKRSGTVTETQRQRIRDKVDEQVEFGGLDTLNPFGDDMPLPDALRNDPKWNNLDNLTDFVALYSKTYQEEPVVVIQRILKGEIDPRQGLVVPGFTVRPKGPQNDSSGKTNGSPGGMDLSSPYN